LPFAILPIRTAKALAGVKLNAADADAILEGTGAKFFYLLWAEPGAGEGRARMFFYGGEDPATGSAAGCAASWLVRYGIVPSDREVLIRQGVEAGRPSEITVRATKENDRVTNVRVGGRAVEIVRGTLEI
jgi:trans-2,3-dihydro-3-hydroxyanthranilate isomerase